MRIGIDARLWNETGVGRYIRNLISQIDLLEAKTPKNKYYVLLSKKQYDTLEFESENIEKVLADVKWHTMAEQVILPKILNNLNLDLMHFTYFSIPLYYKRPFIVTIHDLIVDHFSTGDSSRLPAFAYYLKRMAYKKIMEHSVRNSKKIIAPSVSTKKEIVEHYKADREKISVIYEGGFEKNLKDQSNEKIGEKYFLYVGNAYPHKNLDRLVEAFESLIKEQSFKNIKLVMVLKKDKFSQKLAKRCSGNTNIVIYNDVSDFELVDFYRNTIGVVIPSLMEGFGLPAVEAMSLGSLVIASKIPSLEEICRDAAIYFDPGNPMDMREKMGDALKLTETKVKDLKKCGFERAKFFSWKKMAEETISIYESCNSIR